MATRNDVVADATRRARRQLDEVIRELIGARRGAGLSQAAVAASIAVSRSQLSSWERGRFQPSPIELFRWAAVVGLELSLRAHDGGDPLRDAGQLKLLARFKATIGDGWNWRTEVSVTPDPYDRRAFDAVLTAPEGRVAVEAVARLQDSQREVRSTLKKQESAGVERLMLVLADTRHNRAALLAGAATLRPAFPCPARDALGALRHGALPPGNAVILV